MLKRIEKTDNYESDEFDYKKHIISSLSINQDLDDFITGKIPQGFKSGCHILDNHFVSKKNEFYIVTGKKGQGKTTIYQILQLMFTIPNNLIWVVAFQENSSWSMKLNMMNLLLGKSSTEVKRTNPSLFSKAEKYLDNHFIFIKVDDIKTATDVCKGLISDGFDIHALLLDPINSFKNGWSDTGNGYADGLVSSIELLKFAKEVCSVHITQHPNMAGQRQEGSVTSYQAEGGWFLNKAHNTCTIHREQGSSINELRVEHLRNKHTGGNTTEKDNPIVINWSPYKIDVYMFMTPKIQEEDVIQQLVRKYDIFKNNTIPKISPKDAFGDDVPF